MSYQPGEWNHILQPGTPWRTCYDQVEFHTRLYLKDTLNAGDLISTNTLVEALYPARFAKGEGITARRRMYKALAALATHGLADCCTKGVETKFGRSAKMVRPWLWHAPRVRAATVSEDRYKVALGELLDWLFRSNPNWNSISTPDEVVKACAVVADV